MSSVLQEIAQELRSVLSGQVPLLDVILPPLAFTVLNGRLDLLPALGISLGVSAGLLIVRLVSGQGVAYTLSGAGLILISGLLAWVTASAEGFFLPGLITSGLTLLAAVISLITGRPLAAWSSHITRGWPLDWYWHPRIRPAYLEVTIAWAVFFLAQFLVQGAAYLWGNASTLGWVQLLSGWPALIPLLIGSYLYGLWRLGKLNGPSVEEFQHDQPPPWEGQQRGF